MTSRTDMRMDWNVSPRIIQVDAPSTSLLIQDLVDTIRDFEYTWEGMSHPLLLKASGKDDLGALGKVGITASLQDAQVAFQQRTTIQESGTITTAALPIVNGISLIDSAATFVTNGVSRGSLVWNITDNSFATVKTVTSENELFITLLGSGTDNDFDIADSYRVYLLESCKLSGGNATAVDSAQVSIEPVFPTFGVSYELSQSTSATLVEAGTSGLTSAESDKLTLIEQILRNEMRTDIATGKIALYDDNDNVLLTADVFEDAAGTIPYSGGKIDRKNRLT